MKNPNNPCLFCNVKKSGCAHENELAYASYDSYPVSDHHCLIIPKVEYDQSFQTNNIIKEIISLLSCYKDKLTLVSG